MTDHSYLPFGKPSFDEEEIAAATRVLRSGWVGMGPETQAFERELSLYLGASHVVTVDSCTSGLFLSLLVSGVGPGDEVICPSFTWCSTANAALYLGARPVFCDIDPDTLSATAQTVLAKLTPATKAVVIVHYGGLAMDTRALRAALPPAVALIEDAAHSFGASLPDGRRVGALGNLTCFSFYANKNLSTGEGGAIALDDPGLADRLTSLRLHALPTDAWQRFTNPAVGITGYKLEELGYKMNYTDLQASIGRVQLRRQDTFAEHRARIAHLYRESLIGLGLGFSFQDGITDPGHARHLFVTLLPPGTSADRRNHLVRMLRERGVGAAIHYLPLHAMPLYASNDALPVTDDVAARIMTLPIGPAMSLVDAARVVETMAEAMRELSALT